MRQWLLQSILNVILISKNKILKALYIWTNNNCLISNKIFKIKAIFKNKLKKDKYQANKKLIMNYNYIINKKVSNMDSIIYKIISRQ
jgi:hypothetical protein